MRRHSRTLASAAYAVFVAGILSTVPAYAQLPFFDPPLADSAFIENETFQYQVRALSLDPLALVAHNIPPGATFEDNHDGTGLLTWLPPLGSASSAFSVTFDAVDLLNPLYSSSATMRIGNSVYGRLFDEHGSTLDSAFVKIQDLQTFDLAYGVSNLEGRFALYSDLIQAGTYRVTVDRTGCESKSWVGTLRANRAMPLAAQMRNALEITSVDAYGSWPGYIHGVAHVADPSAYKVAVYIRVPGSGWWTKPTFENPFADIQPDGTWSSLTTTGGADNTATMFAAYLIPASYAVPGACRSEGYECVPQYVRSSAESHAFAIRPDPAQRRVQFSGREWLVKSSATPVGPGPNYFSDSTGNVWVDDQGKLHLKITQAPDGTWQCAEVMLTKPLGYGRYEFQVEPQGMPDSNSMLGLFVYSEECAYASVGCWDPHREIDLEFMGNGNGQFVVQPYTCTDHLYSYPIPLANFTSFFDWRQSAINFGYSNQQGGTASRTFPRSDDIPKPGAEQTHINLYLTGGVPGGNQPTEVIISSFDYR